MKKVYENDYFMGFDIGTGSIGYAITDERYNVLKFNGKSMWGSRLFDSAETAAKRRNYRCNTRRVQRRRWRIELLQELFSEEISKVDLGFFQRLKDSALYLEDKRNKEKCSLFYDCNYNDRNFYEQFPTIYHLRKALICEDKEFDIRLVYLAIHHIIKNRGHFLFTNSIDNATSFNTAYENFIECMEGELNIHIQCDSKGELEYVLKNKLYTKKEKSIKVMKLLNCSKEDKQLNAIIKLISGDKSKLSDVFQDETLSEIEKSSVSFSEGTYEEIRSELEEILQERCNVLDVIKSIYDWAILADILNNGEYEGNLYLSIAKANKYEEHKQDLLLLKKTIKNFNNDEYKKFFNSSSKNNYCAYVGFMEKNKNKISVKKCSQDDFYKSVKNIIEIIKKKMGQTDDIKIIETKLANKTFMPLQRIKDNGVVPYQVNYIELKKILDNAKKHFEFLSNKDSDGIEVYKKILSLLEFKIPYYVGPLNTYHNKNSWMVRKEFGRITPWNFDKKVDVDKSANLFIRRMTNKCTYLIGKDVLPKNSLLYSDFMVWNEINNIRINNYKLPIELKEKLYEYIFRKYKRVTGKMLFNFLKSEGVECKREDLTGFDKDFKSSLKSYIDFKNIFQSELETVKYKEMVEKLVLYITLYGADIKMLRRVIRNNYSTKEINELQLKQLTKLKYDGWGTLSKELLTDIVGMDNETGECFNIIQALRNTNDNFMQILSQKYTFINEIERVNLIEDAKIEEITYDSTVRDIVASPAIKRSAWQVILLAEEIKKVMGKPPKKIFIEVAREHQKSQQTVSRKNKLIELYKNCEKEERDWKNELENKQESDFRSIKLYLYYTQMGKCMYSGDNIELSDLADSQIYDRDHIYPQSLTKDDSIDNLVLVKKTINATKSNDVISPDIQNKMCGFWKQLRKKGFISEDKYNRLMRKTPLTDEELAGFINRQLVETRQSSKLVANLFKQIYPDSEVVYVKAKSVSDFRHTNLELVKTRSLNDLHHAKDAYLNIVVGNVYYEKFTNNPLNWLKTNKNRNYNLNKIFNFDLIKGDNIIWKVGKNGTLAIVKKQMKKNDILCTRYLTVNKGELFNIQIVGARENANVPIKKGMDISRYGGYKGISPAYFALIESSDKKGNRIRTIESVPLYKVSEFEKDRTKYIEYCMENYGLEDPKIVIPKIKKNSLIVMNKFPMNLRGTTGKQLLFQCSAQLCLPEEEAKYFKKVEKYIQRNTNRQDKKQLLKLCENDEITSEENIHLFEVLINKETETIFKHRPNNQVEKIESQKEKFISLSLEEQVIVINEIINLMRCKPSITADLSLIGGSKLAGSLKINKNISLNESVIMINQSVTGLFEQKIDLLKI